MKKSIVILVLVAGCSESAPPPPAKPVDPNAPPKIKVISKGQPYSTADYLVPGYVTILEFFADW